jgi:trk system potassium uptake protein
VRVIIIGGDKTVYFLARQFVSEHHHVTVLNRDPTRSKEIAQQTKATVVVGEGSDVQRLEEAGARQADVLLALTSHDQDNLIACQIAQRIFGLPRVMALVSDPDNEAVFRQLGVETVFSVTRIIGSLIHQQTGFDDITALMPLAQGRINVTDVRLAAGSPAIGKTLIDLDLSEGSLIACIIRDDEVLVPRGSTRLQVDDHLVLISDPEQQEQDLVVLLGEGH